MTEKQHQIDLAQQQARDNRAAEKAMPQHRPQPLAPTPHCHGKEMQELHVGWFKDDPELTPVRVNGSPSPNSPNRSKPGSPSSPTGHQVVNPASQHRELMNAHTKRGLLKPGPVKVNQNAEMAKLSPTRPGAS